MKVAPLWFCLLAVCPSCTTLENRRDLYRAPSEGYEEFYPEPPPTRLPSTMPGNPPALTTRTERQGVITFPEEPALPPNGR